MGTFQTLKYLGERLRRLTGSILHALEAISASGFKRLPNGDDENDTLAVKFNTVSAPLFGGDLAPREPLHEVCPPNLARHA